MADRPDLILASIVRILAVSIILIHSLPSRPFGALVGDQFNRYGSAGWISTTPGKVGLEKGLECLDSLESNGIVSATMLDPQNKRRLVSPLPNHHLKQGDRL